MYPFFCLSPLFVDFFRRCLFLCKRKCVQLAVTYHIVVHAASSHASVFFLFLLFFLLLFFFTLSMLPYLLIELRRIP